MASIGATRGSADFVLASDAKSAMCVVVDPNVAVQVGDSDLVELEFTLSALSSTSSFVVSWSAVLSGF